MNKEFLLLLYHTRGVSLNLFKGLLFILGYLFFLPTLGWSMYPFAKFQEYTYLKDWIYEGTDNNSYEKHKNYPEFFYINNFRR